MSPMNSQDGNVRKLNQMEAGSNEVILRVSSYFPLQLFPDSIVVDKNKIDIVHRDFFWTKSVFTILLEDLTTINVFTGPLFATVRFEVRGYEQNPEPIKHLPVKDAVRLREIVLGLTKATREAVDLTNVDEKGMIKKLRSIGQIQENIHSAI